MSSSTYVGNSDAPVSGYCAVPPPPPPPPPVPSQMPTMRISTTEPTLASKRPQFNVNNIDAYEPPAAIQNAMLTKDKKPFTYTPGMGGKLDLSQIRSPRMARRVAKNANDEGIEGPPKSSLEQTKQTTTPTNTSAGIFVQPQVAVPVFPTNVPPQLPTNRNYQTPALNRTLSNATEKQLEPTKNVTKEDVKVTPIQITPVQPNSPETPSTPQVTLIKAPTPWLQNKNKSPEELPEWAKRSTNTKPTQNSSPESPTSPMSHVQFEQQPTPQWQQTQRKQLPTQQKQQPQQYQFQTQPLQSQPQAQPYPPQQKRQTINQAAVQQPERQQTNSQTHQQERVIPIRIEDRPSVFAVKQESSHHQLKQPPSPHHQQRWGQPSSPQSPSHQCQTQTIVNPPQQQHSGGAYIIPIMIESNDKKSNVNSNVASIIVNAQPNIRTNPVRNETPKSIVQQRGPTPNQQQQADIPPVQSRSFRVLQKITDLDSLNDVDLEQLRKLQPSEDDRILMNKFKEQVDGDTYLHQEEDPRYRGAAIPSRAFRFLQNMTESGETTATPATSRVQNVTNKKQNRNSKSFEETQINLPPSEQQVPEPKKYMGSAIPSRSFRILQAMTAPESIATQENRQADYTCQTENNVPGNQQSIYFPPCPVPYWHPDGGWWAYYYPIQYPHVQPAKIVTMNHVPYDPYVCEHRHDNGDAPRVYYHQHDHRPLFDENNRQYEYDPSDYDNTNNGRHGYVKPQFEQVSMNNSQCEKDNTQTLPRDTNELINDGKYQDISVPTTQSQEKTTPISQQSKDPHLGISGWHNINDMSKISSSENNNNNSRNNDENNHRITARLNIIEEEEEVIPKANATTNRSPPTPKDADRSNDNHGNKRDYSSLKVSVPNYTYLDTSDSSDTESDTDSESITETSDSNDISNVETTNDTLSDSDSDSYLAYSTGLNPHHKHDELTSLAVNKDDRNCYNDVSTSSSENLKYIKEEEEEEEEDKEIRENKEQKDKKETIGQSNQTESLENITDTLPSRRSSIIYEDTEHVNTNTSCDQYNFANKWKKKPFETTDDPPDDISTTVSVSLPLRFKFSVSENNEDVTTVIVGDSKIKPEKFNVVKNIESIDLNRLANNESLDNNFRENSSDTTVDFTLKRSINTAKNDNIDKDKGVKDDDEITPHVNFTLKKAPSKVNRIDCGETVVTEFTVKPKPTVDETTPQFRKARLTTSEPTNRKRSSQTIGEAERSKKKEDRTISSTRSQKEQEKKEKNETIEQYLDNRICKDAKSKDIIKLNDFKEQPTLGPELIVSEYTNEKSDGDRIDEKTKEQAEESNQAILTTAITATINDRTDILEENDNSESSRNSDSSRSTAIPCEDVETKQQYQQQQHLLGVYTPREETDDEDSGVTSDMSRMISEAETDSECCATSKNIRKYQRTQTHSRLFRLLNDENDDNETSDARTSNRDCLTLSLNTYPYDDSYCSNYSSGFTSPDYSPVHEHSSKKSQQNNEDFLIVGRPDSQQHDAERHGNTSLHRRGMSLHQHCLPIAKIHKEGSIPNATSTTTNDIYFKTWKDTPKTCNSSEKDDVLRSLAFKTLNRKIPYWAYKVNVLCPRIKSTKNVPRTLKKCPTNDDDENDNGSLIKPTITDPLLSYVDDNNNSNSNNNN